LEIPVITKSLETLIDHVGVLYKYHDRPITYLYNTYHFFEATLRDKILLKRKLVSNIVGEFETGIKWPILDGELMLKHGLLKGEVSLYH